MAGRVLSTEGDGGVWSPAYRTLTAGLVLTITLTAVEALAVITILPLVKDDLGGLPYYGWVTSAFFLGTVVGVVIGGREADRRGPASVYTIGLILFGIGLAVGGLAPAMPVLVVGRAIQGLGAGAVPTISYAIVARTYPERLRPRVFAVLSTAWVLPGLVGPALSVLVAERFGWRTVFLGILPLIPPALLICIPVVRKVQPAADVDETPHSVADAVRVAVAAAFVLAALSLHTVLALPLLVFAVPLGARPLLRLLPAGTLRARSGQPATILVRGLVSFSFLGAETFVPLAITAGRGQPATLAGLAMTAATVAWTVGSWAQQWLAPRVAGRYVVMAGLAIIVSGIAGEALTLQPAVPPWCAAAAWGLGAFGMGLAYATLSVLLLAQAPEGMEGRASAGLQLADNLGVALGAGVGGAAVALLGAGAGSVGGLLAAFAVTGVAGCGGVFWCRRLPALTVPRA